MEEQPFLKKPKVEIVLIDKEDEKNVEATMDDRTRKQQEAALVALVQHRTREVEDLQKSITDLKSKLIKAEKLLEDTQNELATHRGRNNIISVILRDDRKDLPFEWDPSDKTRGHCSQNQSDFTAMCLDEGVVMSVRNDHKVERGSPHSFRKNGDSFGSRIHSKPQLVIASATTEMPQHIVKLEYDNKVIISDAFSPASVPAVKKRSNSKILSGKETLKSKTEAKNLKRGMSQPGECEDLISLIGNSSSLNKLDFQTAALLPSQHKRKLRCLELSPTDDKLFATSALDGVVNVWQIQESGSSSNLLSTSECQSERRRRWPEDIAWHPYGNKLFSVYTADGGDSQISIMNLNREKGKTSIKFLKEKPHVKGIINNIIFMPWVEMCFVTGGSDRDVVLWKEQDLETSWKPKSLHRNLHSSAVMGVCGIQHKKIVMSAGADKRIIGFDMIAERADYKHQIESKCMSVLTNPCDFNLFMVQSATPERQLKLFDLRTKEHEINAFGWKQETSESQSALINQSWSPNGLHIVSGSTDPIVHTLISGIIVPSHHNQFEFIGSVFLKPYGTTHSHF